jgi:hypothetical protein
MSAPRALFSGSFDRHQATALSKTSREPVARREWMACHALSLS